MHSPEAVVCEGLVRRFGDFGTKVRPEGSKYVWFGTDHVFDAFTFAFVENEHVGGVFEVIEVVVGSSYNGAKPVTVTGAETFCV